MASFLTVAGWLNITLAAFTGGPLGGLGYFVGAACIALAAALQLAGLVRDVRRAAKAK